MKRYVILHRSDYEPWTDKDQKGHPAGTTVQVQSVERGSKPFRVSYPAAEVPGSLPAVGECPALVETDPGMVERGRLLILSLPGPFVVVDRDCFQLFRDGAV